MITTLLLTYSSIHNVFAASFCLAWTISLYFSLTSCFGLPYLNGAYHLLMWIECMYNVDRIAHHSAEALGYINLLNESSAGYETSRAIGYCHAADKIGNHLISSFIFIDLLVSFWKDFYLVFSFDWWSRNLQFQLHVFENYFDPVIILTQNYFDPDQSINHALTLSISDHSHSFTCNQVLTNWLVFEGVDELSRWWGGMVAVAAYWLTNDMAAAERLYPLLDSLPKCLQSMK